MPPSAIPSATLLAELLGSRIRRYDSLNLRDGGAHSDTFNLATDQGEFVLRIPRGRQGFYTAYLPRPIPRSRWFDQHWALDMVRRQGVFAPRLVVSHPHRPRFV